jgi:hypothetical protein
MTRLELVIIGVIIVALLLVILWASSGLGDMVEPTRTGHAVILSILGEVQKSALAREAVYVAFCRCFTLNWRSSSR